MFSSLEAANKALDNKILIDYIFENLFIHFSFLKLKDSLSI